MLQPGAGFGYIPPITKNLIIINVLVFLADMLMPGMHLAVKFALFFPGTPLFEPYQFVTSMFTHAGFTHLLFNMLGLFFAGSLVERYWGPRKFLGFYLACGIAASLAFMGVEYFRAYSELKSLSGAGASEIAFAENAIQYNLALKHLVGASGAIYGVLVAFGLMFPNEMVSLMFLPIPMKARTFVFVMLALDVVGGIVNSPRDPVAHFAHLGGGILGLLLVFWWRQRGKLYSHQA